ncbi:MAG: S46 family peptidase [Acidobacteria bacterium]|nr:S46 family peptidase [Acidobacteriota bacterium]
MKRLIILLAGLVLLTAYLPADEGMFAMNELDRLDAAKLKSMGLEITMGDVTDRVARAVLDLGGGSGSFVSPDGLIVTNHHVAYRAIQYNSTGENNYIVEGFYAPTRDKELPAPGYTAGVLLGWEDVTQQVIGSLTAVMTDEERFQTMENAQKRLQKEVEAKEPNVYTEIAAMYQGKYYLLFRYLRLRDIRLVYAPPDAVGEFGGDIDNFEWPRHTGDFSFMRAYVGPDGRPADYAPENVPYHPEHYLNVSRRSLAENDFTMVIGYPGSTDRYLTSGQIRVLLERELPLKIRLFRDIVALLEDIGRADPEKAVRVASLAKGLNNAIKKYEGDFQGLTRDDVITRFSRRDVTVQEWISGQPARQHDAGLIADLNRINDQLAAKLELRTILGYLLRFVNTLDAGRTISRWAQEKTKPDLERDPAYMDRNIPELKNDLQTMQRNLLSEKDLKLMVFSLQKLRALPAAQRSAVVQKWFGDMTHEEMVVRLDAMISGTGLLDADTRLKYFDLPAGELAEVDDPLLAFAGELGVELKQLRDEADTLNAALQRLQPRFIDLLHAYSRNELYPDANSTMRLTYGKVTGYAKDGVTFTPFTTLDGAIAKERGTRPFANPPRLIQLYRAGEFGDYAEPNLGHRVPLNFLSDVDTTGGNSGSPTLNGKGELIGLLFDGNFESISSDYFYNPALTRSIVVDARYMLYILDKFSHATALLEEMTIVR